MAVKAKQPSPQVSLEYQLASLKAAMRDQEERTARHNAERDLYVEDIEQQALDAISQRNVVEHQLLDLLNLGDMVVDAVRPGAIPTDVVEQALRRVALALAAGDVPRAHRALNDAVSSAQVQADQVTEVTLLSETDLFEDIIRSALEHIGAVTVGDLIETSEDDLHRKCHGYRGHSLGRARLAVVFDARRRVRRTLERTAEASATYCGRAAS